MECKWEVYTTKGTINTNVLSTNSAAEIKTEKKQRMTPHAS